MSALELFDFDGQELRVVLAKSGEPWFVAVDIARALGYRSAPDATRLLDEDMKGTQIVRTLRGDQQLSVINEPGLYRLIMRSQRPEARAFERKVVTEILPTIRRTGAYGVVPQQRRELSRRELAEMVIEAEDAKAALAARVEELEPAAAAWNELADATGDYSVADAAKILSRRGVPIGRDRLFEAMDRLGWIYRSRADRAWHAMQTQIDTGRLAELPRSHEHPKTGETILDPPQVRVTMKGLEKLLSLLGVPAE